MLALFVGLPLLALGGAYLFRNWRMQSALDAEIGAAVERGEPVTFADMLDARAATPETDETTRLWREVNRSLEEKYFAGANGRLEDLDRIAKGKEPFEVYDAEDCPFEPPADAEMSDERRYVVTADAILEAFRPAVETAHDARRSGNAMIPEREAMRTWSRVDLAYYELVDKPDRLLDLEFRRALELEDRARMREALLTSLALIAAEGTLPVGHLNMRPKLRFQVWTHEDLARALDSKLLTDDDLDGLAEALEAWDVRPLLRDVGPAWRLATLERIEGHEKARNLNLPEEHKPPPRLRALSIDDRWKAYEISRRYVEGATDYVAAFEAARMLESDYTDSLLDHWRFYYSWEQTFPLRLAVTSIVELEAFRRVSLAAIACERFRLANDRWPANLDELVPNCLEEGLTDPFDDQPLRYRLDGEAMTVYSLGMNGKDDGGLVNGPVTEIDAAIRIPPEEYP